MKEFEVGRISCKYIDRGYRDSDVWMRLKFDLSEFKGGFLIFC